MKPVIYPISIIYILLLAGSLLACKQGIAPNPKNPKGYALEAPEKFSMPENLLEISGIAFNNYDPSRIYSVQDEEGRLFSQQWGIKKTSITKFGPMGDYEDLSIMNEQVFVLRSSGHIYGFTLEIKEEDATAQTRIWKSLLPKGEYESLYADEQEKSIYVLTKSTGKKNKNTLAFRIRSKNGNLGFNDTDKFELDVEAIEAMGIKLKSGLKASALGRHPVTKEWYILSSAAKLLVIANPDWTVKSVHQLDGNTFHQPEGIAFDSEQNLYISNEGDEITNGNILKFKYNGSTN